MNQKDSTLCPVCSLYLREGITLKSHLQTHSKEKVIEALLYKQDPSSCVQNNDDSESSLPNTNTESDTATNSNVENKFFSSSENRDVAVSTLPSSFLQPPNSQVATATTAPEKRKQDEAVAGLSGVSIIFIILLSIIF